jgi:hypothetical protein
MHLERELDFIVIGVQKGGTTSLWQYLRGHPRIAMPDFKEASIFCMRPERIPETLEKFMTTAFDGAPADARLGKVSTHYMMGAGRRIDVEGIVERIAEAFPEVRLIALLRDPIERAISHYRMSLRRGFERRSLDDAVEALLEPEGLEAGRRRPSETNSYLAQGEYGRILRAYVERFGRERIHAEATADLGAAPGLVVDRVLDFLGLPPGYRPEGLEVLHHRGGNRPRLDAEGEAQLRAFMDEHVWSRFGEESVPAKLAFDFFMQTWNVVPDDRLPPLSGTNRSRLEAHYRADAESLAAQGFSAPWLDSWDS